MVNTNRYGSDFKIIEYNNIKDITVLFKEGYRVHTSWTNFVNGKVKNVYDRSIYNKGYLGEGDYKAYIDRKATTHYKCWRDMLRRCYDKEYHARQPTYKGCTVCEEWLNFQNFAKWYEENYYEVGKERMELDKDILIRYNKIYSKDTCIFVPKRINDLFINNKNKRGNTPLGVSKRKGRYITTILLNGKTKYIGSFDNEVNAFNCYKRYKEILIRKVSDEYKDKITEKLYVAMMNYRVDIRD